MIARQGNQRYFMHTFRVSWFCDYCIICKIDEKLSRNNIKLSRHIIGKWLYNHPKSPWWILNTRVTDYCMINGDGKLHNTTILGKCLPRKTTFWQHKPGVSVLNGMRTVCWVIFNGVLNAYWFCIIHLCLWVQFAFTCVSTDTGSFVWVVCVSHLCFALDCSMFVRSGDMEVGNSQTICPFS